MKCIPCAVGGSPLTKRRIVQYMRALKPKGSWRVIYSKPRSGRLVREYAFGDFVQAMRFVGRVAKVAEANGHHPDIQIHWNKVQLELYTHSVGGLSESDFIVASKINLIK